MAAVERFEQMTLLVRTTYRKSNGSFTAFVHSPSESQAKINDLLETLFNHSKHSKAQRELISAEVEAVLLRAQGSGDLPRL